MANMFLAYRLVNLWATNSHQTYSHRILSIYHLTKCRVQCGVVIALSVIAFVLGMVTNVIGLTTLLCGCFHTSHTLPC
jgi:uncharacterized membrane protein